MKKKLKPMLDLDAIQKNLIDTVCGKYVMGTSVRELAKQVGMSPMKVRKILITGGCYATDLSCEIAELWHDGKTVPQIAEILSTTISNVNSYLPYERIVYGMEERSVEADRQQRYRDRKKGRSSEAEKATATKDSEERKDEESIMDMEETRTAKETEETMEKETAERQETIVPAEKHRQRSGTMIIVIGKKLRKYLPDIYDATSDPISREANVVITPGQLHEPEDPDRYIWCAEVTSNGRGKDKKLAIILMSANSGFAVISPLPTAPELHKLKDMESMDGTERQRAEWENWEATMAYRKLLEYTLLEAIRKGMKDFCLPENRVADYIDTVLKLEIVKGHTSMPAMWLEKLLEQSLVWQKDEDPLEHFKVRENITSRKFGYSPFYRRVDEAIFQMLRMTAEEQNTWMDKIYGSIKI